MQNNAKNGTFFWKERMPNTDLFLKKRDSNLEFFENFEMRITLKFSSGKMSLFLQKGLPEDN